MKRLLLLLIFLSIPSGAQLENLMTQTHESAGPIGTNRKRWVCYVLLDDKVRAEHRACEGKTNMNVCGADDIRCEWNRETRQCVGKTQARCLRQGHAYCYKYVFSKEPFTGPTPSDGRRYRCDAEQLGEPLVPLKWK